MSDQLTVKELSRRLQQEKYDLKGVPVCVLLPDNTTLPVVAVTIVGDEKDQQVMIHAGVNTYSPER